MTKVKMHDTVETPSQTIVKAANQLVYVTDSRGRKLGLRQIPFLEEFRVLEAIGPERALNTTYLRAVNFLLYLAEIDGEAIAIPRNHLQIEALIQRAGREGYSAITEGIEKHFATDKESQDQKIKNSPGTSDSETVSG